MLIITFLPPQVCVIDGYGPLNKYFQIYIHIVHEICSIFLCKRRIHIFIVMGYCNFKKFRNIEQVNILDTVFL
jgi:hypothetical protein